MNGPLIEIFVLAVVAGIILFRLYTVLGRRTGHERSPQERYGLTGRGSDRPDNVVALPDRAAPHVPANTPRPADPVARGLFDIKLADRTFETDHFLSGARAAYEMIVTAFAAGNRDTLKPLLSSEVFQAFDGVIRGHEERGEKVDFTFVGFDEVKIVHAELRGRSADVTVSFGAKYISTTSKAGGEIVEGDPKAVCEVTDVWTFCREVSARDPNWILVATSGALP
jgi:predicted lipid-binding transport protein (Tim44 family)